MKCAICGNEIPDSETVCPTCGAAVLPPAPEPASAKPLIIREDTEERYVWYIRKKLVYGIGMIMAAVIALCIAGSFVSALLSRVDVTKYLTISADGYDGYGTISYHLDEDALLRDVYDLEETSGYYDLSSEERAQAQRMISALKNSISADSSLTNLSNGDSRVFTFNNLKDIEKTVGIKFKNKSQITYKVETLMEATTIGVYDLFDVSFTGYNGAGCVVLTPGTSRQLPFNLSWYGDSFYIDHYTYTFLTSGNEGTLSNGDSFTLQIKGDSEAAAYLRSAYGIHLATDEKIEYSVKGLAESQKIDIFAMAELTVSGLDGEAKPIINWKETEKEFGDIRVAVEDADGSSFQIYTTATVPTAPFGFAEEQYASGDAKRIASFYINADKTKGIYSGDEITFRISASYYDDLTAETFASSGLVFETIESKLTVDNTMVARYITSEKQVTQENIAALSETMKDGITQYLKKNWSQIVHGNSGFVCYDQTITEGPTASKAYFACTSSKSNSYTLWVLFTGKAKDSETTKDTSFYIVAQITNPTITAGESSVISGRSVDYSYYKSMEKLQDSSWYEKYEDDMTTFTLK